MKVLLIHNSYRTSAPSGEDAVFNNERDLLQEKGLDVVSYEKFNDDIDDTSLLKRARLGINYAWSQDSFFEVKDLLAKVRPDIAHVHSIHPQISPSVYFACQKAGVPVVHTLHNYRYICPGALLQRDGQPCEDCVGRWPFPALKHRCYRGSLLATGSVFWMISRNRLRKTFTSAVNRFIALTQFAASRFVAGGLPATRMEIKPNFLPNPPSLSQERENYAVYIGRLSAEKGVETLVSSWKSVDKIPLKILGDGPLRGALEAEARQYGLNIEFLGSRPRTEVLSVVGQARFQLVPSEWYEGFPMVILEAYACGTPVVASRIGSLAEVIHDGETGLHFEPGNPQDLAQKVKLITEQSETAQRMGNKARQLFMEKYTAEQSFAHLMGVYQRAQEDLQRREVKKSE